MEQTKTQDLKSRYLKAWEEIIVTGVGEERVKGVPTLYSHKEKFSRGLILKI